MDAFKFTSSKPVLFFLIGQYSLSKPIDDKQREARSDIKKGTNFTLHFDKTAM